ncbi:hypothetical protein PSY31_23470, partial [Shigella flexneri]|nr:hypothetical protein [Shigella flexneri]
HVAASKDDYITAASSRIGSKGEANSDSTRKTFDVNFSVPLGLYLGLYCQLNLGLNDPVMHTLLARPIYTLKKIPVETGQP